MKYNELYNVECSGSTYEEILAAIATQSGEPNIMGFEGAEDLEAAVKACC